MEAFNLLTFKLFNKKILVTYCNNLNSLNAILKASKVS